MADPLSISASILAVVTASVVSVKSLKEAVERYRGRDETLRRLIAQLEDLISVLDTLEKISQVEASMLALLKGPVERCRQLCQAFEVVMTDFAGKSSTGFRDWAKMEFKKGDINEFMRTLSGYTSTISIGLGTITLQNSKTTCDVLEKYSEMVQDTTYNLNVQLQRINEKMGRFPSEEPDTTISDFRDESTVIKHCIGICEEAMSRIGSMIDRERRVYSAALSEQAAADATSTHPKLFQAHEETREMLENNRDSIAKFLGRLQERLSSLAMEQHPDSERRKMQLEKDIRALEDSLEVCRIASTEVSRQKVHTFGEVVAEGKSDQVVVTTLADLFNVGKAIAKDNSGQLIGSMAGAELIQLSKDRYSSLRFSAADMSRVNLMPPLTKNSELRVPGQEVNDQQPGPRVSSSKANPNETKKRTI
ncbi:Helo-like-N domain-containing protein [Fusarium keratoplasticum]|uniref:Helo-like-N domain-containing protein n=1 Tax=Fusarium keratoplasticum TaxID=1328300 RepID=A0ACC0QMK2_9HYPO|nr:Helo-like-N domain-containing protein [Fusarium keratoplasticum]KAI8660322.1 Helo-like-N domain-containing protein [Fusarium keratoplasticum]